MALVCALSLGCFAQANAQVVVDPYGGPYYDAPYANPYMDYGPVVYPSRGTVLGSEIGGLVGLGVGLIGSHSRYGAARDAAVGSGIGAGVGRMISGDRYVYW